jgi:hypothetical protein
MGRVIARRLADHPFWLLLPAQAALLFWHLDRLPAWGDEEATRLIATVPWPEALALLRQDTHPPLYFAIAHALVQAWLPVEPLNVLRALSALLALLAGVATYRCWVADRGLAIRWWFTALWVGSPFVLLYGRMARSYSMQMLLGPLAVAAAVRLIRVATDPIPSGGTATPGQARFAIMARPLIAYVAVATLLLYTHYLPAIALIGSVGIVLLWHIARRPQPRLLVALLVPPAAIAAAYAPWISHFTMVGERFTNNVPYALTSSGVLDRVVELAYVLVSFTAGEAFALWAVPLAVLATLAAAWLVIVGTRTRPSWGAIVGIAAAGSFVAVGHWVSYAFIAARLTFVYPFWPLLIAIGIAHRRRGRVAGAAVLLAALAGIGSYVRLEGFLNKAYVLPVDEIAERIAAQASATDTVVLLDPHSVNLDVGIRRRLPAGVATVELGDQAASEARRQASQPSVRTVWIARGSVDRSPDRWLTELETELAAQAERTVYPFTPYSGLDRLAMRLAGWPEPPTYVFELVELRRRSRPDGDAR